MRKIYLLAVVVSMLFLVTSCAMYRPVNQPSGASLHLDLDKNSYTILGATEGTACADFFLGLPIGGQNTYKSAVDKALQAKGGDLIIQSSADEAITFFPSTFFAIYQQSCVTIRGLAVKLK